LIKRSGRLVLVIERAEEFVRFHSTYKNSFNIEKDFQQWDFTKFTKTIYMLRTTSILKKKNSFVPFPRINLTEENTLG